MPKSDTKYWVGFSLIPGIGRVKLSRLESYFGDLEDPLVHRRGARVVLEEVEVLLERIEISKANLSQHMAVLIQKGVVHSRRESINVFYKLSDERITKACDLMREVLIKSLEQNKTMLEGIKNSNKY